MKKRAKKIILALEPEDFTKHFPDSLEFNMPLWAFGKEYKKKEIYIKVAIGMTSHPVICVSFHIPDFPIKYPFKDENSRKKPF